MALEVIPSGKALGAEIRGIDLSEGLSGETLSAVNAAWLEHLVLLFRNQTIDDHQLLRETGDRVMNILFDCDEGPAPERDHRIISQLQQLG